MSLRNCSAWLFRRGDYGCLRHHSMGDNESQQVTAVKEHFGHLKRKPVYSPLDWSSRAEHRADTQNRRAVISIPPRFS